MASVTMKVDGLRELGERMRSLSSKTAVKFSGRATGKAGSLVKKAAKNNLKASPSIDSGLLEKNVIIKKIPKSKTALTAEHVVTVKRRVYTRAGGERVDTRKVGSLLEHGTVNMAAEPYLRPALSGNIQPAIEAMKTSLSNDILKECA